MKTNNQEPQITSHAPHATSNIFSFRRFGRYASAEFRASSHTVFTAAWVTAAIYVGLILIFTLIARLSLIESCARVHQLMVFGVGVTSAVMISAAFKSYHNSMSAPRVMMLPVSQSEKFIYALLYNVVLIPTLLFGIVYLINTTIGSYTEISTMTTTATSTITKMGKIDSNLYLDVVLVFCAYLLGAALFRRAQFILSSVSILVIFIILGGAMVGYITSAVNIANDQAVLAIAFDWDRIINIITNCMIPVAIFLAWLRFRSLQLKK